MIRSLPYRDQEDKKSEEIDKGEHLHKVAGPSLGCGSLSMSEGLPYGLLQNPLQILCEDI